jgi:hypothetical protein
LSSALVAGENYKIAVTLYDASWTWILEKKSDLTITANLGVNDFAVNDKITIVNPVGNELQINYNDFKAQSLRINDISGRLVKSLNNLKSVNVSDLKQGIYFLTLNNNKAIKFIKD